MQALNERDCECGCGMGKFAGCLKKDPNCPRSPQLGEAGDRSGQAGQGPGRHPGGDRREAEAVGRLAVAERRRARRGRIEEGDSGRAQRAARARPPRRSRSSSSATSSARSATGSEPTVKACSKKYGKDVALVWMNQPLPFHDERDGRRDGVPGGRAPERGQGLGAARQDVRQLQDARESADIEKYAAEVGLNVAKLKKDWDDPKIKDEVEQDQKVAGLGRRQRHADVLHQRARAGRARSPPTRSRRSSTTSSRRSTS